MAGIVAVVSSGDDYLGRPDTTLRDLPYGVAVDIRSGSVEGFEGLDAPTLQERIRQLGDPESIAREAAAETRREASGLAVAPPAPIAKASHRESKSFAINAALVLGLASIVVPVGGWIGGTVMVTKSSFWHRWEKLVGIITPAAAGALIAAIVAFSSITAEDSSAVTNPLLPASYDVIWSSVLLVPLCAAWLLWRLKAAAGPSNNADPDGVTSRQ